MNLNIKYLHLLFTLILILVELQNCLSFNKSIKKRSSIGSKYFSRRNLWKKNFLSYSLRGDIAVKNQTTIESVKYALKEAFQEWENNSCFNFQEVSYFDAADIKIIFTNDKHVNRFDNNIYYDHKNCSQKFRGTAAHAFFRTHKKFPANIHINNEIFWIESKNPSGSISLKTVLLHEIGHILGLYHSQDYGSVMYESIFTHVIKKITSNDRNDLFYLYKSICDNLKKDK